ncbi:MAG: formylglycine-generating enzyme family protein [Prolixibacteraceae bacterium]|jgi:formylglycine-generating enzyme required for sulfatase activity|nr:formylglycine-generating enzyme family protein [Prolixibacteraceae bacterium]
MVIGRLQLVIKMIFIGSLLGSCSKESNNIVPNDNSPTKAVVEKYITGNNTLEFTTVPAAGGVPEFQIMTSEVSYEEYVIFLNEAYSAGKIKYNNITQEVTDEDGNSMTFLNGSRVVKDHNKNGEYELDEMENPLNINFIAFDHEAQRFYIEDPATVDWNQYFDSSIYPNVVDQADDWVEVGGNPNGFVGSGDLDGQMPILEEVKTWPANFIRYHGASKFAEFYGYTLPTVKQWKNAARGNEGFEYATSDGTGTLEIAWIGHIMPGEIHKGHVQPVKSLSANPLGIYNLGGNVWEWCFDWYRGTETFSKGKKESDFYVSHTPEDPNHLKALFGGSFNYFIATMGLDWNHAAMLNAGNDHFGFRVVKNK